MLEYQFVEDSTKPHVLRLMVEPFAQSYLLEELSLDSFLNQTKNDKGLLGDFELDNDGIFMRVLFEYKEDAMKIKLSYQPIDWITVSGPGW